MTLKRVEEIREMLEQMLADKAVSEIKKGSIRKGVKLEAIKPPFEYVYNAGYDYAKSEIEKTGVYVPDHTHEIAKDLKTIGGQWVTISGMTKDFRWQEQNKYLYLEDIANELDDMNLNDVEKQEIVSFLAYCVDNFDTKNA